MSVEGLEEFHQDNFSQGLDLSDDPTNIADIASPDTENVRFYGETWGSRPGFESYLDALEAGSAQGLSSWEKNNSLVRAHNGKVQRGNESTNLWVDMKTGLNTSADFGFEEYLGDIYYGNGVDAFGRIQHTSYTTSTPGGAPMGNLLKSWAEKMWVAGNVANPRTIYYSVTALAATPQNIYDFGSAGSGSELIGKKGEITGLETSKNALIIFKDTETYYVRTFDSTSAAPDITLLSGAVGCVGKKAYCKVKDEIFFFTGDDVRVVSEFEGYPNLFTASVSKSIRRLFKDDLDPDQSAACMTYNDEDNLVKLWVKTLGATNNDKCLVYHLDDENKTWTIDSGKPAKFCTTFKNKTYWSSVSGSQVWKDEVGLVDDVGAITTYRWSKKREFYSARGRKKIRYYTLAGKIADNTVITVKIYVDGFLKQTITIDSGDMIGGVLGGSGAIGTAPIGTEPIGGVNAQVRDFEKLVKLNSIGRYVQTYIESTTLGGYFRITDEHIHYIPMPRAAERNY